MSADATRPTKTFELKSGAMPSLKPADTYPTAGAGQLEPETGAAESRPAKRRAARCVEPDRDMILRLIEMVKAL